MAAVVRLSRSGDAAAVNMRAVASALGVSAKLLYRHVRSKEELLDLVADDILSRWKTPDPTLPWRSRLTELTRTGMRLAVRFPELAQRSLLRMLHAQYLPHAGQVLDAIGGCLREAGLSKAEAERVQLAYYAFILGGLRIAHAAFTEPGNGLRVAFSRRELDSALDAGVHYLMLGIEAHSRPLP